MQKPRRNVVDKNYLVGMKDFLEELLVVLVIYEMKIEESPAYHSLTCALLDSNVSTSLFIYDNSREPHDLPSNPIWSIEYFHDRSNSGVSKAYNEGFQLARQKNKRWMLLADQDTEFPGEIFIRYKEASFTQSSQLIVPLVKSQMLNISPYRFTLGRGKPSPKMDWGYHSLKNHQFINSGLFVSTHLFERCQGYDEQFPLDFSDLVFIERLRQHCRKFLLINAVCKHSLSSEVFSGQSTLNRFPYFLRASKLYGKLYGDRFFLFLNRFLRSLKLSYQFRSVQFISLFFQIENENLRG